MILERGDVWAVLAHDAKVRSATHARPFVVLSPPELLEASATVIAAPVGTGMADAPFRVPFRFKGVSAVVVLDQLRTVEKARLLHRAGKLSPATLRTTLQTLTRLFAP